MTWRMPGTVSEVSATLVASTIAARRVLFEDAFLVARRQARIQRQHFGVMQLRLAERLGRIADLLLARQEYQHVAALGVIELAHRGDDAFGQRQLRLPRPRRRAADSELRPDNCVRTLR